mgnify:CR=1 FL=1
MKNYKIKFIGRHKGAIGIFETFVENILANSLDDAILALYEKYEHIRVISHE